MATFTKDAIKSTFIELLNEKPLSQITVKLLVEECGINRNSFYYHFEDLPALIEDIIREEADRIIREYPNVESLDTALKATIDFASKNKRAILHIYNSVNRDIFEHYLWEVCEYAVRSYGDTALGDIDIDPYDREVISNFYRCECFGVALQWLNQNMEPDIQKQISRFCELHRGVAEEMIQKARPAAD
ncbi:MAG: TetR/AcrR family transcriptional regulator [Lachnospiraceae bacterium]|nr:TetR/AcrR family transcriptional regulator [Lachnospiraceae bacterium]